MPNFDGGHYFLTALLPVKLGLVQQSETMFTSHTHSLRDVLAYLPPALQSPANERRGVNSPFSRARRTHFARLVVITDVTFNGRTGRDTIVDAIQKTDLLVPQKNDQLPSPYLLFVADFDAKSGDDAELLSYLHELWTTMEPEWRKILQHCHGFQDVDPEKFVRGIRRCQVETTMPFNDYWQSAPDLKTLSLGLPALLAPVIPGIAALVIGIVGVIAAAVMDSHKSGWAWLALVGVIATLIGLYVTYTRVVSNGAKPLPSAPDNDLPSVLKSLYLQQKFVRFAIDAQGATHADLHAAFGRFIDDHQPDNPDAPTQPPGIVRS